jgi:DNA repair photolyase
VNRITLIEARSVLTAQDNRSSLPYDYTINPYRGCLFGCSYCYASRFVHEDAEKKEEWGTWVEVKANAVDALQRESHKLFGKSIFLASATDPYQPVERKLELTRALLEVVLMAYPAHVHIQTRSPLVVRDIALFRRFGESLTVGISIPTDSDIVRRAFEPRAPAIFRRLQAAQELRAGGIRTTAAVAPLLPCTPQRLARMVARHFDHYWVGKMNRYEKAAPLAALYAAHNWERYAGDEHLAAVKQALEAEMPQERRQE